MTSIHISTARRILQAPEPVDLKCWTKSGAIIELHNAIPLRYNFYEGKDTLGDVIVKLSCNGRYYTGKGLSTDILEASITAYINAINKLCADAEQNQGKEVQ